MYGICNVFDHLICWLGIVYSVCVSHIVMLREPERDRGEGVTFDFSDSLSCRFQKWKCAMLSELILQVSAECHHYILFLVEHADAMATAHLSQFLTLLNNVFTLTINTCHPLSVTQQIYK